VTDDQTKKQTDPTSGKYREILQLSFKEKKTKHPEQPHPPALPRGVKKPVSCRNLTS
jgi:hypothetical protein